MKILINGGLGFVGINLINLLKKDMDLVIIDALVEGNRFDVIKQNIADYKELQIYGGEKYLTKDAYLKIFMDEKPDVIVNLASLSHVDSSFTNPSLFYRYNVEYFNNLLQAISEYNKDIKFIHMSTDEVFGSVYNGFSIDEEGYSLDSSKLQEDEFVGYEPTSPYSISKTTQEMMLKSMQMSQDLTNSLLFRSTNLFGKYQDKSKLIPKVIERIKSGNTIPVYGDGSQKRTWLHVSECVNFIKNLITHEDEDIWGKDTSLIDEMFHISNKKNEVTNLELIQLIGEIIGKKPVIEFVDDRKNHDTRYSLDYEYTKHITGFNPSLSLIDGLNLLINGDK